MLTFALKLWIMIKYSEQDICREYGIWITQICWLIPSICTLPIFRKKILFYLCSYSIFYEFWWHLGNFHQPSLHRYRYVTTKNDRIQFNSIILNNVWPTQKSISYCRWPQQSCKPEAMPPPIFFTLGLSLFLFSDRILCLRLKMRKKLFIPGQADTGKSLCPWSDLLKAGSGTLTILLTRKQLDN